MGKFLKKNSIFTLIIVFIFSIAVSSAAITRLTATREVSMVVVDSESAFISLPEIIEIDYIVDNQTTDGSNTNNSVDVRVGNNMPEAITLENIIFDDPNLKVESNYSVLLGSQRDMIINIKYEIEGSNVDMNVTQILAKATFYFTWDNGSSTIYKDVIINIITN